MALQIVVIQGSILDVEADVIVNAANSHGLMGGGVAGVIKRAAGEAVEREAMQLAPIPVGQAILTAGGDTKFQAIIHAPTMADPGMRIPAENVARATRAALTLADKNGYRSMAIPGMGTGVGGVHPSLAAQYMIRAIRAFSAQTLQHVILVDIDAAMIASWRQVLSSAASGDSR